MTTDPQIALAAVLTMIAGYTMFFAGVKKHALELRRRRRVCPSCGRNIKGRICDSH